MRWLAFMLVLAGFLFCARPARAEPQRTTIGVYVVQVNNIDLKTSSFTVDLWLWFRSAARTTSPIDAFEIIDAEPARRGSGSFGEQGPRSLVRSCAAADFALERGCWSKSKYAAV